MPRDKLSETELGGSEEGAGLSMIDGTGVGLSVGRVFADVGGRAQTPMPRPVA